MDLTKFVMAEMEQSTFELILQSQSETLLLKALSQLYANFPL